MSRKTNARGIRILGLLSLVGLTVGCTQDRLCLTTPDAIYRPVGYAAVQTRQQLSGPRAGDFVVYEQEWMEYSTRLNAAGRQHIHELAKLAAEHEGKIILQPATQVALDDTSVQYMLHNDRLLDDRRRAMLVEVLTDLGVPHAEDRVLIATPYSPGT